MTCSIDTKLVALGHWTKLVTVSQVTNYQLYLSDFVPHVYQSKVGRPFDILGGTAV